MRFNPYRCLFISMFLLHCEVLFAGDSLSAAPPSLENNPSLKPKKEYNFFGRLGEDIVLQAEAPFQMTSRQALWVAGGVVVTAGLIYIDEPVDKFFKPLSKKHRAVGNYSPIITEFGGTNGVYASLAFAGYSLIADDKKAQQTSILLAEAFITSGLWVRAGKLIFGRERPSAQYEHSHERGGHWYGPINQWKSPRGSITQYDAFPSGHTATAFALATVFAEQYSNIKIIPPLMYTTATIVGITRMVEHTHWISDVFVGGCVGYVCGKQVVANYRENYSGAESEASTFPKTRLYLGYRDDAPTLNLLVSF